MLMISRNIVEDSGYSRFSNIVDKGKRLYRKIGNELIIKGLRSYENDKILWRVSQIFSPRCKDTENRIRR